MPFTGKYKAELVRRIKDGEHPKDIAKEEDVSVEVIKSLMEKKCCAILRTGDRRGRVCEKEIKEEDEIRCTWCAKSFQKDPAKFVIDEFRATVYAHAGYWLISSDDLDKWMTNRVAQTIEQPKNKLKNMCFPYGSSPKWFFFEGHHESWPRTMQELSSKK